MFCCLSKKSSSRSSVRKDEKKLKPVVGNGFESSSGFSESSTVSSRDFVSSGFSVFTSSSSSTATRSGCSSTDPISAGAFVGSSLDSGTFGLDFSNRFDVSDDYLENPSKLVTMGDFRGFDNSPSSFSSFAKGSTTAGAAVAGDGGGGGGGAAAKRLQIVLPPAIVSNGSNGDDGDLILERERSNEDEPPALLPCAICARTFMPQSLEKHRRICENSAIKKRKPFDSAKQRIQGTDLAEFLPKETIKKKIYQEEKPVAITTSKATWKQTHDEFIRAIQAVRDETIDVPPQRQSVAPNPVTVGVPTRPNEKGMCPTCNRLFSIKSYERHVAWCKERVTRAPINVASNVAKERLEARMKYRAPLLKNRRITNREKYAPGSAVNLPTHVNKNSTTNSRAKESSSTPNCNNKGDNESTTGCGIQNHQRTTFNAGRSSQEATSTGPMKSRLSDRSSRPSAIVESGPTANLSPCPIPPSINERHHLRISLKKIVSSNPSESPPTTCRSVGKSGTSRSESRECESSRKIVRDECRFPNDRRTIELNIFDGSKNHRRDNIVSARSQGYPRVNDVSINDELVGMTVQSCGTREKGMDEESSVRWKQIGENDIVERAELWKFNDDNNEIKQSGSNVKIVGSESTIRNESIRPKKSAMDLEISGTIGIKNLNQTYLIRESLDVEKSLSEMIGERMNRPIVDSPRTKFDWIKGTTEKNDFGRLSSDGTTIDGFDDVIGIASSPITSFERNDESCERYTSVTIGTDFLELAELATIDLKIMDNDAMSDRQDTSRSADSIVSSLQTCRKKLTPIIMRQESIVEKASNLKILEERDFVGFDDRRSYSTGEGNIGSNFNRRRSDRLPDSSRSARSSEIPKDDGNRSLTEYMTMMKTTDGDEFDGTTRLSLTCENEKNAESKNLNEIIEDNDKKFNMEHGNRMLDDSGSLECKQKIRPEFDSDEPLDFEFLDDVDRRVNYLSKSIDDVKIGIEKNNETPENSRLFMNTATTTDICKESLKKKIPRMRFSVERMSNWDENVLECLDMDKSLSKVDSCRSVEDFRRENNNKDLLGAEDDPRTSRSAAAGTTSPAAATRRSLSKKTTKSTAEPKVTRHELFHRNSCDEKNNESTIDSNYTRGEVKVSEAETKNYYREKCEEKLNNVVEKTFETHSKNSFEKSTSKPIECSNDTLMSKKIKKSSTEQPKNYQRCGTYVIDRAKNFDVNSKNSVSDESPEEKPVLKRRRTDELDASNEKMKNSSNSSNENNLKPNENIANPRKRRTDHRVKSAKKLERPQSKIQPTCQKINVIHEKYVNSKFDCDSDAADDDSVKDKNVEFSTTTEDSSVSRLTSNYDLHSKALSDSLLPRRTSSSIVPQKFEKQFVPRHPSEMREKLKKNMSLLRSSTDSLINSVEAREKIYSINSPSIVESTDDIEKILQVEEETIRKIDLETVGEIVTTKTSFRGFLPEITIDRVAPKNDDENERKFVTNDGHCSWKKIRRNSNPRLINLDHPECRETRVKNIARTNVENLPPVVPASFRKIKRRTSYRDPRSSWNNYVRRRPDFDLVLTGRTGSCSDYDPFVLAERQMRELISDTCSDQSFTDYSANLHTSASPPNYPLSHSSAFVKYPDPLTKNVNNNKNRVSVIAPPSEFDDLAAGFSSDSTETNSITREIFNDLEDSRFRDNLQNRENRNKDTREHVLGRRVIIDKSKALGTNETIANSSLKNSQTNEKARKIFDKVTTKIVRPHVTRSNSVRSNSATKVPERKNNNTSVRGTNKINSRSNPGSGTKNRNNNCSSLSGSNVSLSSEVSSDVEVKRSNSLFDEVASSLDDDGSCNYPSLRSLLKNDSLSVSSPVQSNLTRNGIISDEDMSSPDSYQRQDHNKLSADSAYSSLNRKYSNHGRSTNEPAGRQESPQRRRDGDVGSTSSAKSKLSKFCHECGCKFPETAKFCCECGIRRLTL